MLSLPVDNEECPFFAMGILLLATALYSSRKNGTLLRQLSELVFKEEERIRLMFADKFRQTPHNGSLDLNILKRALGEVILQSNELTNGKI